MDWNSFEEELERQAIVVFSLRDVARITAKPLGYTKIFLNRLVKRGRVARVERGKYCIKGASDYEVASNLVFPSYVSFLSALAFHKLTTQIPVVIQVACKRQRKSAKFGGTRIEFVRLGEKAFFGFKRFGNAFVAEAEKAVVDGLYLPQKLPLAEAAAALKELSAEKLCEHADRLGSSVVKRRLGYLLERAGRQASFAPPKTTRYALLNPGLPAKGQKNRKWMLLVNEVLE
ncbi:MAG: type IV toxin-antitoxin system AbiEi family antitoxin domain-containing protein [Candidatus Micrarchaeota archaeon]